MVTMINQQPTMVTFNVKRLGRELQGIWEVELSTEITQTNLTGGRSTTDGKEFGLKIVG